MYNAEILADSINPQGDRITTFKLTYPRIVHAELMTHRMFSRNAASSRAVPVKKMIESVRNNMFTPLAIQKVHKGMQGSDYFEEKELEQAKQLWIESAELALQQAEKMEKFGITKQLINRILEPYQYYQVLVTATEWENFFELRCPQYEYNTELYRSKKDLINSYTFDKGFETDLKHINSLSDIEWLEINRSQADIHIQAIAELMYDAYNESTPKQLQAGEYHLPFGNNIDLSHSSFDSFKHLNRGLTNDEMNELKLKVSVARCARISYETLGDNPKIDYEADIRLHDMLLQSKHFSPFEHCARAMSDEEYDQFIRGEMYDVFDADMVTDDTINISASSPDNAFGWCRNFRGFIQYRHLIENNNVN